MSIGIWLVHSSDQIIGDVFIGSAVESVHCSNVYIGLWGGEGMGNAVFQAVNGMFLI